MTRATGYEAWALTITAVPSDTVLARIVVLVGARGGRIRELRCRESAGRLQIWCVVETAAGRASRVAAALARVVDVTSVEAEPTGASARLSALA